MQVTRKPAPLASWQARQGNGRNRTSSSTAHRDCITFRNHSGQIVGKLVCGWLTKQVDTKRHQLRVPRAWCSDAEIIEQLRHLGARGVKLIDERGRIWTAPLSRWQGARVINRGHGEQYVLTLPQWDVEDPTGVRQLGLFAEVAG